jgi:hypothetical protein
MVHQPIWGYNVNDKQSFFLSEITETSLFFPVLLLHNYIQSFFNHGQAFPIYLLVRNTITWTRVFATGL